MTLFQSPLLLIGACVVMLLHILPRLLHGVASFVAEIVNIILHISLLCAMLLAGIPLDEVVLVLMLSLFIFTLSYLVSEKIARVRGGRGDDV